MLEAHDVGEKPRRRLWVGYIEKHAVKCVYGELRGDVGMERPAGRCLARGGSCHELQDQPIGILAA